MKAKILGIKNVNYVSKRTNQPVTGMELHTSFSDAQVSGQAVDAVFINDNLDVPCRKEISVGKVVNIEYNSKGYVCGLEILPDTGKEGSGK